MKLKKILSILSELNIKTVYFNFKYLPFKHAIYLPFFISRHVYLKNLKGCVHLPPEFKTRSVRIGYKGVGIFDHKRSRTIWEVDGTVIFKGKATIGHGSKIHVGASGKLILGADFKITAESSIVANKKLVEFGSNCLISWDTLIMDTDFHHIFDLENNLLNEPQNILIGNDVWIGCRCTILKGASIPNATIIAANSVVNSKPLIGNNRIFAGVPAREIKSGVKWKM